MLRSPHFRYVLSRDVREGIALILSHSVSGTLLGHPRKLTPPLCYNIIFLRGGNSEVSDVREFSGLGESRMCVSGSYLKFLQGA